MAGNLLAMTLCVWHDDHNKSLAVYDNTDEQDGKFSFWCFGCKRSGVLTEAEKDELVTGTKRTDNRKVRVYSKKDTTSYYARWSKIDEYGSTWFNARGISTRLADNYGIRQSPHNGRAFLLPCYSMYSTVIGAQVRYLSNTARNKYMTLADKDTNQYPRYSFIPNVSKLHKACQSVFLVESIIDGLSLYDRSGVPAIAMLGTQLDQTVLEYFAANDKDIYIVLDPDAQMTASILCHQLGDYNDGKITVNHVGYKPYELSKADIMAMVRR